MKKENIGGKDDLKKIVNMKRKRDRPGQYVVGGMRGREGVIKGVGKEN